MMYRRGGEGIVGARPRAKLASLDKRSIKKYVFTKDDQSVYKTVLSGGARPAD
jgi:hypothetical protein